MKNLIEQEDIDKIKDNSQRLKGFNKQINNTYDKNLDNCLVDFVEKYELDECEILHYLRKFVMEIKNSLK